MINQFIKFNKVKSQNYYITEYKGFIIHKSYNTIVAISSSLHCVKPLCWRVRYSSTTGKQITRFLKENYENCLDIEQNYVNAETLQVVILLLTSLNINTNYNECMGDKIYVK